MKVVSNAWNEVIRNHHDWIKDNAANIYYDWLIKDPDLDVIVGRLTSIAIDNCITEVRFYIKDTECNGVYGIGKSRKWLEDYGKLSLDLQNNDTIFYFDDRHTHTDESTMYDVLDCFIMAMFKHFAKDLECVGIYMDKLEPGHSWKEAIISRPYDLMD